MYNIKDLALFMQKADFSEGAIEIIKSFALYLG